MNQTPELANALVRAYADAWIAHRKAKLELEQASSREAATRKAYQDAWRDCSHLEGMHIVGGQAVLVERDRDYPPVAQIVSGANR